MTDFNKWLDTFVEEKGVDLDFAFEVEGDNGLNIIPVGCIIEFIKDEADEATKKNVKDNLVKIDFMNGDVMHFFNHCAKAVAF